MTYKIEAMPDCCWTYIRGVNQVEQSAAKLKSALLMRYNSGWSTEHENPPNLNGAIMFCGAYGGDTVAGHLMAGNATSDYNVVVKNVEWMCNFFEEEDCGTIVDMPPFRNELHNSDIIPAMLIIDETRFKKAMTRWAKELGPNWKNPTKEMW